MRAIRRAGLPQVRRACRGQNAVFLRVAKAEGLQVLVPSRLCAVADRGVGVMVMGFEIVEVAAPPREGGGGPATVFVIQRDGRTLLADRPGFDCPEEAVRRAILQLQRGAKPHDHPDFLQMSDDLATYVTTRIAQDSEDAGYVTGQVLTVDGGMVC